jgi:opacity protein-like surface antigen
MKTSILTPLTVALLALSSVPSTAQPMGASDSPRDYLVPTAELGRWSAGIVARTRERDVTVDGSAFVQTLKRSSAQVYLGYRPLGWLTTYGAIGASWAKLNDNDYGDMEVNGAVGLHANLLYHDLMSPALLESHVRLDLGCAYALEQTETAFDTLEWNELSASLLLSIVNDVEGNKLFNPESVALFAGPIVSDLSGDLDEDEILGFTVGLDVNVTERITLTVGLERFDAESVVAGINVNY